MTNFICSRNWWSLATRRGFLWNYFKSFGSLFLFNLFLFLWSNLLPRGRLRYFSPFTLLFCLGRAVVAREGEVLNVHDLTEDDIEALRVEPLFTDVAGDHIRRLWLPAYAVYLCRATYANSKLVINRQLTLLPRHLLQKACVHLDIRFTTRISAWSRVCNLGSLKVFWALLFQQFSSLRILML